MMTIKIVCVCGQKYAFDVEPYLGRMPSSIACPVCGVDGTARANEIMAQNLAKAPAAAAPKLSMPAPSGMPPQPVAAVAGAASAPPAPPPPPRTPASTATVVAAPTAAAPAPAIARPAMPARPAMAARVAADDDEGPGGKGDTWKWYYYILAGLGIGGYSVWQAYDQHRIKPLGELILAALLIAVGVWDFQRKRRKRA